MALCHPHTSVLPGPVTGAAGSGGVFTTARLLRSAPDDPRTTCTLLTRGVRTFSSSP